MPRNTSIKPAQGCQSANTPRTATGFPRQLRLLSSNDYQQVFKHTECRSVDHRLTILARQNELGHARLGLAISKRMIKTAVGRNRIKRLVRESFRLHQQALSGLDIVVMSRNGAPQASNPQLLTALQTHWQRVAKKCVKA